MRFVKKERTVLSLKPLKISESTYKDMINNNTTSGNHEVEARVTFKRVAVLSGRLLSQKYKCSL